MTVMAMDKRFGDLRHVPNRDLIETVVYYIIDHRYRKSVNLSSWLAGQVELARNTPEILAQAQRLKREDDDLTMQAIFNYVRTAKTWRSDWDNWNTLEYWEDVTIVYENPTCDCESGSLLMYCLGRLAGVAPHNLYLWCGDVYDSFTRDTFGHAVLLYKPLEFPLNYVMLDWCWGVSGKSMYSRNKFTMLGSELFEYKHLEGFEYSPVKSGYIRSWFAINENKAYRWFR